MSNSAMLPPSSPVAPTHQTHPHHSQRRLITTDDSPVSNISQPPVHAPDSPSSIPLADTHQVRAPKASKKVTTTSPGFDEIKAAVERDALRKEAKKAATRSQSSPRNETDVPSAAASTTTSPASSPSINMAAFPQQPARPETNHPGHMMARGGSIDSTISTGSSVPHPGPNHKHSASNAYKVSHQNASPTDIAELVSTAGSAEAAIVKLIAEKNTAASHHAQLWRLVEKQRAMILGLNKDLEKSLKEKERYRRKLKDSLAESQSAPSLTAAVPQQGEDALARETSQSPVHMSAVPANLRDISLDGRKASDVSDIASAQSENQHDVGNSPSRGQPATPLSASSIRAATRADGDLLHKDGSIATQPYGGTENGRTYTPPVSPPGAINSSAKPGSQTSPGNTTQKGQSFSSPKQASRKAPPAPLQLSPLPTPNVTNNIIDPSDSEYEDDPDEARAEQMRRGRRKTREEDDREREYYVQKEMESRSKSKRDKKSKSKSKSKTPAETPEMPLQATQTNVAHTKASEIPAAVRLPDFQLEDPRAIVKSRAAADAAGMLQRTVTAPSLLSPGLPMSPRPMDRPMNSPMPRAPNKGMSTIPMSPRTGLPLSPRAPNKAIPLPPQTPLTFASPHLARANNYHEQMMQQPSIADRLNQVSQNVTSEQGRPSTEPKSPGEIYTGLVSEQYSDLLMPPNALPSIFVKVASSRMRPSRNSYMAPKSAVDENPVFTMGIHARSDNKQLWRIEKSHAGLTVLDQDVKSICSFRDRVPDKALFAGHAPAKIDARRKALDTYFDRMLDSITDENAARVVCKFLSNDAIPAEGGDDHSQSSDARPDSPMSLRRPRREGYLTKRGKNFGGWKARYFVLDGPQLKYFEAPGGAHMGSIKLQNAQIGKQSQTSNQSHEDEENQFRHAFLVLEPKRKDSTSLVRHVLCAESDVERDAWVEALLAYVDYADGDESNMAVGQGVRPDISGSKVPRSQRSLNDLRPPSRGKDASRARYLDSMQAIGYSDTVPGEAPVMVGSSVSTKGGTPSPPHDADFATETAAVSHHPTISAPTNAMKIDNAGDWGMKVPPTPGYVKDKKRSIFAGFRGRSSSDLDNREKGGAAGAQENGVRAVFGVPLAEAVEYAHPVGVTTELPAVVYRCIEYLTAHNAVAEEGIFRLSGSNTVIKALRERFNTEGDVNLLADEKYYDIHAVASLLKLYLRELPASILTRELHLEFLQCVEKPNRVQALNVLAHRLPIPNLELLKTLTAFLLSIVNNVEVNKMNIRNVGIVFSPTLNVPAPLISTFVEDQSVIFGELLEDVEPQIVEREVTIPSGPSLADFRSPRKQMFTDLATPSFNQTSFQNFGALNSPRANRTQFQTSDLQPPQQHQRGVSDTGFVPAIAAQHHQFHPSHSFQPQQPIAQHGDGGFGSLNDALFTPAALGPPQPVQNPPPPPPPTSVYNTVSNGQPTSRERDPAKQRRRESGMHMLSMGGLMSPTKKPSLSRLKEGEETEGGSF